MGLGKTECGGMQWAGIGWVDNPRYGGVFTMGREEKGKSRYACRVGLHND